jgi:hypothetical protein
VLTHGLAGFQLLHAVYIVEKLLQDLLFRRCQFQIVCFDLNEDLCVPKNVDQTDYPKYAVARSVIFRHLAHNLNSSNKIVIRRFNSFRDAEFTQYLKESGIYFVMCHDGAMPDAAESKKPLHSDTKEHSQAHVNCQMLTPATENSAISSRAEYLRRVSLRAMISWFISKQYNVALLNELSFSDSKVLGQISSHHHIPL